MNISINFAKTAIVGAALLVAFSAVFVANAVVTVDNVTLNGATSATVEGGASVDVDVTVTLSGSGPSNDWESTSYQIGDGPEVCINIPDPDLWTSQTAVRSFDITAPSENGDYPVVVRVYRDNADGSDNNPDTVDFGNDTCDGDLVVSMERTLTVFNPIDPFVTMESISPLDEEKYLNDTITYTAEIAVGGDPVSGDLQCVVFDIYNEDGWQVVDVSDLDYNVPGTYFVDSPVYSLTDANGFALIESPYDVIAIALDTDDLSDLGASSCAEIEFDNNSTSFTTDTYHDDTDSDDDAETLLYLVEPQIPTYCVFGNVWGDENQNGTETEGNPDGEEGFLEGWGVQITNGEETFETTTDGEGGYEFCVPAGEWTITQISPEGWTYSYPSDGEWTITLGLVLLDVEAPLSFIDQVINFFVPTALAAVAPSNGPLNFGVFQRPTTPGYSQGSYSGGGGGNGVRIELTDDGDDDRDEDEDEEPEPQVLGEATSVIPQGAPATGAGGSQTSSFGIHGLVAILASRGVRATNGK